MGASNQHRELELGILRENEPENVSHSHAAEAIHANQMTTKKERLGIACATSCRQNVD